MMNAEEHNDLVTTSNSNKPFSSNKQPSSATNNVQSCPECHLPLKLLAVMPSVILQCENKKCRLFFDRFRNFKIQLNFIWESNNNRITK